MEFGISTASLFTRKTTEEALDFLSGNGVPAVEIFLSTYFEYKKDFADILKSLLRKTKVHSVHTLTTQFEPQLYSVNERAKKDAFSLLENVLCVAETVGAENYTFHGGARYKKQPLNLNFDKIGRETGDIITSCESHGITLTYENVHWGYYNYPGFFKELKKRCPLLKGVLDIKQAFQSGFDYEEYVSDMGESIKTLHLTDFDDNGKLCLPGKGKFDFKKLFNLLKDYGFDGAVLIEAYSGNYGDERELLDSLDYIMNI